MDIVCSSSLDMMSELPSSIIEIILMFLPMRDAARTCILSRKWRYRWTKLPELLFDDTFNRKSLDDPREIVLKIYEVLLLHQGPILKFSLNIPGLSSCSEIDKMILFLSRNGIRELSLCLSDEKCYKLPSYIFSCQQQLGNLNLRSCVFKPPPMFKGFSKLISLELVDVELASDVMISCCPLLERLTLKNTTTIDLFSVDAPNLKFLCFVGHVKCIGPINSPLLAVLSLAEVQQETPDWESFTDFIFSCVPLTENLHMNYIFLTLLTEWIVPNKVPAVLNYLRVLELSTISFTEIAELSSILCLIRRSPNLQRLKFKLALGPTTDMKPVLEYLRTQDLSDVSLDKLREVEMENFTGLTPDLEFIKFILALSPGLEKMHVKPASSNIDKSGYKMLIELARFPRASPKAEIIFPIPAD